MILILRMIEKIEFEDAVLSDLKEESNVKSYYSIFYEYYLLYNSVKLLSFFQVITQIEYHILTSKIMTLISKF